MPVVTRFAPAPTGYLHLGHVLNALHVWDAARRDPGGRVLLRIEDHDRQRSRKTYEDAILDDLSWLAFTADEPLVRQSERCAIYEDALASLRRRGLVYACYAYAPALARKTTPETMNGFLRIIAFILLCIGVQIAWNGLQAMIHPAKLG